MAEPYLKIENLSLSYYSDGKRLRGLRDVSLELERGRILGVVGESGSGKSTLSFAIPRLLPQNAKIESGSIRLDGVDVTRLTEGMLEKLRGDKVAMIFQDPLSSLHPCMTIGRQMLDAQRAHSRRSAHECDLKSIEMLERVGIADPKHSLKRFPHQFSGGMRQRVMIAIALLLGPSLLIADEPTSALDVVLQGQIMALIAEFRDALQASVLIVSHDLAVVGQCADAILVMYAGDVMEYGPADAVMDRPRHPYTQDLLQAIPSRKARGHLLQTIPGRVPSARAAISGCAFAGRCKMTRSVCYGKRPALTAVGVESVRCHMYDLGSGWHSASEPQEARAMPL
jgi:oligopeptide/dipeptide ABC transporter ATP-binding protein